MDQDFLTIDQAVSIIRDKTGEPFEWRDLFAKAADKDVVLHCRADNLPIRKTRNILRYEREADAALYLVDGTGKKPRYRTSSKPGRGAVGETLYVTVERFNGYFDTSLTDDGLAYVCALAHDDEHEGIGSIEIDGEAETIADLHNIEGLGDFPGWKFEWVNDGRYKPSY
jgi:hypothetical protein